MYNLVGKCRTFDLPVDLQLELFRTTVGPIILYGCEVWGNTVIREVDILHMRFFKLLLCVQINACNDFVYGELGTYPFDIDINVKIINYWSRLINGKHEKFSYVIYEYLLHLGNFELYTSPWIKDIRSILNNCGLSWVWLSQKGPNPVWLGRAGKQKLKDQWQSLWHSNVRMKSVCSNCLTFKCIYGREEYLTKLKTKARITLTKIRTNNNRLPITGGKYQNVPREERICDKCDDTALGDEYYVILV